MAAYDGPPLPLPVLPAAGPKKNPFDPGLFTGADAWAPRYAEAGQRLRRKALAYDRPPRDYCPRPKLPPPGGPVKRKRIADLDIPERFDRRRPDQES